MAEHKRFESVFESGQYKIPWTEFELPGYWELVKFAWDRSRHHIPSQEELDRDLPVVKPDFEHLDCEDPKKGIWVTWLGHACVLVQMDGVCILTDPVFSNRCGPKFGCQIGYTRYRDAPCDVEDLPPIDAVVISHNHYDHLDLQTVYDINTHFPDVKWFVPLGLKDWMTSSGCKNVQDLDWWQTRELKEGHKITFVPAQHWSSRGALDYNKALWGGWCIISEFHKFYFAGDTGYDTGLFEEIGKLGPFDLAAIPIGAYSPRDCMMPQHVNPEEALKIHEHIKARKSIGIHWGTFHLSSEPVMEPREWIKKLQQGNESKVENQHGEVLQEEKQSNEENIHEEYDFFTLNPGGSKFIEDPPQ